MTSSVERGRVDRFRDVLRRRFGWTFNAAAAPRLAGVLAARAADAGGDCDAYLAAVETGADRDEDATLADALTVPESHFFRYPAQFANAAKLLRADRPSLRVLSAGCAAGEEPYTFSLLAAERARLGEPTPEVRIVAVDASRAALARARRARYSAWSLRETPADVRARYFRNDGAAFVLDEVVRARVTFEERNLATLDDAFLSPGAFDLVFLRNVTIYWDAEVTRDVVDRVASALTPDGRLYLGHAETLRGVSSAFELRSEDGVFYYAPVRRSAGRTTASPDAAAAPRASPGVAPSPPAFPPPWQIDIERSAARVETICRESTAPRTTPTVDDPVRSDLARAAALTNEGRFAEAEDACRKLLRDAPRTAEAHYLLALCKERAGDPAGADVHDRAAAEIDPSFAMPRLHRGLLAKRAGAFEIARLELRAAAELLRVERPDRIEAFGGDFGREALVAFCRAEGETRGAP